MNQTPEQPDAFATLCRHLVALTGTFVHASPEQRSTYAKNGVPPEAKRLHYTFSGVPVVFNGEWYVLTAGHAVIPYIEGIRSQQIFSTGGTLFDSINHPEEESPWMPFEIADYCEYMIDDESLGLDYAMLRLSSNHTDLISTRDIVPLVLSPELPEGFVCEDRCILAGMPTEHGELLSVSPGKQNEIFMKPHTVPIRRTADDALPYPRFVGQIANMHGIDSIVGMSGGPIFGMSNDQYTVVALQSRWTQNTRTVYATQTTGICQHFSKQNTGT